MSAKDTYKSRVYTDRPAYADYEPAEKFEAIKGIIATRLKQHPKAICSYSGGSDIVAKGPSAVLDTRLSVWVVRRLTPTECERLQGFPDDWTKYDTYGIQIKDTPRYAALGNSIAIPCALRVFEGILDVEIGYRRS